MQPLWGKPMAQERLWAGAGTMCAGRQKQQRPHLRSRRDTLGDHPIRRCSSHKTLYLKWYLKLCLKLFWKGPGRPPRPWGHILDQKNATALHWMCGALGGSPPRSNPWIKKRPAPRALYGRADKSLTSVAIKMDVGLWPNKTPQAVGF